MTSIRAKAIHGILAGADENWNEMQRWAGLDDDTLRKRLPELARLKLVNPRILPTLASVGAARASFIVCRPPASVVPEVLKYFDVHQGTALLWAGRYSQLVFAVVIHSSPGGPSGLDGAQLPAAAGPAWAFVGYVPGEGVASPYFDFEGTWRKHFELPLANTDERRCRYPRSFPGPTARSYPGREAIFRLLSDPNPFPDLSEGGGGLHLSTRDADRYDWVHTGELRWRMFLGLPQLYRAGRGTAPLLEEVPEDVFFVKGVLRSGESPGAFIDKLIADCRVYPFLYVSDGTNLLLALLGGEPSTPSGAAPNEVVRFAHYLDQHLTSIDYLRESLAGLDVIIDHEYDRPARALRGRT